jgi:aspartate carbamoyltransferase regulatory subunit
MALLLAWLAIPTSFVIPSQMIGETLDEERHMKCDYCDKFVSKDG